MINWLEFFYYFISGAGILMTAMGLWFAAILPGLERQSKQFFVSFFIVLMVGTVAGLADTVLYRYPELRTLELISLFVEIMAITLPMVMLTGYLLHCCGEGHRRSWLFRASVGLWAVFFVLLVAASVSNLAFYTTPDGEYARGPGFTLLMLPIDLIACLNLVALLRRRVRISKRLFISFLIPFCATLIALIINTFIDFYPLISISLVFSAVSMLGLILSDQIGTYLTQQREIADQQREIASQQANVLVLQMRPHFIYNTMMSIYSLCNQDARKARQVTLDFTNYLRKNFNAVTSDSPIPFSSELEHTQAYLAVEQAQYEELLRVDYDTPHTRFRVPPLTLQPIAENAVKHGLNPNAGQLRILIRTRYSEAGSEITVEDNGPGFDPSDTAKPHTALENIRQRLEMMCGGKMEITPRDGGGTVVRVTVPPEEPAGN